MKEIIDRLKKYICENKLNVYDVAYMDKGGMIYESLQPANRSNNSYSVSKSFTATAVGFLVSEGKLSLDEKIMPFFSEYKPTDKRWNEVCIRDLLAHTTGNHVDVFGDTILKLDITDFNEYIFSHDLPYCGQKKFIYSNAGGDLLTQIVEKVSGVTYVDFMRQKLFNPLDIKRFGFHYCPKGHVIGATDYVLSTEDFVKFGYAFACNGVYNNKQVIPKDWVKIASETYIASGDGKRYYTLGCFWRNGSNPVYYGDGAYGQMIYIDPIKKFCLAMHSYMETPVCQIVEYLQD